MKIFLTGESGAGMHAVLEQLNRTFGEAQVAAVIQPVPDQPVQPAQAITLALTPENRDELIGALTALLSSLRMFESRPAGERIAIAALAEGYAARDQISSFRKLFQNTIVYLAENRWNHVADGLYTVRGLTRQHEVFVHDGVWSCDCDLSAGRGKYAGHPGECAHVQTIKVALAASPVAAAE